MKSQTLLPYFKATSVQTIHTKKKKNTTPKTTNGHMFFKKNLKPIASLLLKSLKQFSLHYFKI